MSESALVQHVAKPEWLQQILDSGGDLATNVGQLAVDNPVGMAAAATPIAGAGLGALLAKKGRRGWGAARGALFSFPVTIGLAVLQALMNRQAGGEGPTEEVSAPETAPTPAPTAAPKAHAVPVDVEHGPREATFPERGISANGRGNLSPWEVLSRLRPRKLQNIGGPSPLKDRYDAAALPDKYAK